MLTIPPERAALAAEAWSAFLHHATDDDAPAACNPAFPYRNSTVDLRNLSSAMHSHLSVAQKRHGRCEQPSMQAHWNRLDAAARRRGRRVKLVQIGANQGGKESNEIVGKAIRRMQWQAAVIEPVPALFAELQKNYRVPIEQGLVRAHQLVVHSNRSAIQYAGGTRGLGSCSFFEVRAECLRPSLRRKNGPLGLNLTRCPEMTNAPNREHLLQMNHPPATTRGDVHGLSEHFLHISQRHMQLVQRSCVHINDLFAHIGVEEVDVLIIDTEGFDFALMESLDLGAISPLVIEFEGKALTYEQIDRMQRKLEAYGYRVYDANLGPDAEHWVSHWQIQEIVAIHPGATHTGVSLPLPQPSPVETGESAVRICPRKRRCRGGSRRQLHCCSPNATGMVYGPAWCRCG